jgi:hypothetical protein
VDEANLKSPVLSYGVALNLFVIKKFDETLIWFSIASEVLHITTSFVSVLGLAALLSLLRGSIESKLEQARRETSKA